MPAPREPSPGTALQTYRASEMRALDARLMALEAIDAAAPPP